MSKIGNWVLERQEAKQEVKQGNPFDRYSNKKTTAGQYYDYIGHRNESKPRHHLGSSDSGRGNR